MSDSRFGKHWGDEDVASGNVVLAGRGAGIVVRSWAEPSPDPRVDGVVRHGARCSLCEWAYAGSQTPLPSAESVGYGFGSPDVMEVTSWCSGHALSVCHVKALEYALEKKGK